VVFVVGISTLRCLDLDSQNFVVFNCKQVDMFEVGNEDAPALKLDNGGSKMLPGPAYGACPETLFT
jgi:hypothetical protein